jgi:indolepyruvate ferredoxin oxidoreductase alpha subunit
MRRLLSGNEAFAWGAYHSGVKVAAAYPGTPSTEILENFARFDGVYAEWSTNEKVAMEVGMGAAYAGVRVLVTMKQVGLNVAMDPFMAASTTGIDGGMVVISADDPGTHSSQNEQDNRHYGRLAKVPILEPSDSQEAYDIMAYAYDISERFDTPVIVRTTTRISHSKTVVELSRSRVATVKPPAFQHDFSKYVMLPVHARIRHSRVEDRLVKLGTYAESLPLNRIEWGDRELGIVTSGVAYQYAREVFPRASFLRLGMTYPLPSGMIRDFAGQVGKLIVIEELDPFLQESIRAMGLEIGGKEFIPRLGELDPDTVAAGARQAGIPPKAQIRTRVDLSALPKRPPLLCPGCPHTGMFYVLSSAGQRLKLPGARDKGERDPKLIITGDIGCYTLGAYPPLNAMDTTACMGASIGQALGMEKAGIGRDKVVAVIGDSTFLHSGITPLVDAVYNGSQVTVVILDNHTTAMTGHQEHPGTGVSVQGKETRSVVLEDLVRGIGVKNVSVIDAFNLRDLRAAFKRSIDALELSVIIVRGECAVHVPRRRSAPRRVDPDACNQCGTCLLIGCPAIQSHGGHVFIEESLCFGKACSLCQQLCPRKAIGDPQERGAGSTP